MTMVGVPTMRVVHRPCALETRQSPALRLDGPRERLPYPLPGGPAASSAPLRLRGSALQAPPNSASLTGRPARSEPPRASPYTSFSSLVVHSVAFNPTYQDPSIPVQSRHTAFTTYSLSLYLSSVNDSQYRCPLLTVLLCIVLAAHVYTTHCASRHPLDPERQRSQEYCLVAPSRSA